MKRKFLLVLAILAVTCWAAVASADMIVTDGGSPLTIPGSSGSLSASATFSLTGGVLTIVLTNTGAATTDPGGVLTALFFTPGAALTPLTASLNNGSSVATVYNGTFPTGGNVGGEWAYGSGLVGAPHSAIAGISSSGLSPLFGDSNFNGSNLTPPAALDGANWGIVAASTTSTNNGFLNQSPYANNFTLFTLSVEGNPNTLTLGNISFQYGTGLNEPNVPGVPIPPTVLLLGSGLLGLIALGVRRRKE